MALSIPREPFPEGSGADSRWKWQQWVMAHRKPERNPLFAGRWFDDDIILLCLRWYFRFKLSYRDLVAILGERGLSISHTTILRWVVRYAETCEKRWNRFIGALAGASEQGGTQAQRTPT